MKKTPLQQGDAAPEFTLSDQNGAPHSLADYRGGWVLLYFYPKDDTPGCTTEACTIRDVYDQFIEGNITVLGVSADSVKRHKKFSDKYTLPFTLLSDENKTAIRAYGAWGKKKFMGREYDGIFRISFLINPSGNIAKIYKDVQPAMHAAEVLTDVQTKSA